MSDSDSVSSREAVVKQQMQSLSQLSPGGEKRSSKKARELHEENKLLNRLGGIPTAAPVGALKHIYRRGKFLPEEDKLLKDLFAQAAYELNLDSEAARDSLFTLTRGPDGDAGRKTSRQILDYISRELPSRPRSEDRAELIALVDKHGERYGIISEIMKREPLSLREAYHQFQPRFNHGKWSTTDEERFYGIMNRMGYVEGDEHRDIYWPEVSRQMHSRSVNSCIAKWYGQFGLQKRKVVWTPVVDAALVLAVREDGGEYAGEVEWRDVADSVMYIMRHAPAMKPARDESEAAAELVIAAAEVEEQEEQEEAAAAAAAGAGAGGGGSGGGSNVKASSSQSSGNATPVLQGCDCRFRLTALTRRAGLVHLQRDTQAVVDRLEVFLQRVHGKYGDVFQPVKSVLDATREDIVLTDSDSESEADSPGAGAGRGRDVAAVATPALVKEVPAPIAARKRSRSSSSLSCSSSGSSSSDSDSSSQGSSSSSSGATGKQAPPKAARGSNTSPAGKHMLRLDDDDSSSGSSSDNSSGSGSSSSSSSAEGPRPSALSSGESSADDDEDAGMDSDEAKLLQAARRTTAAGRNAASSKKAARAAKAAAVAAVRGGTILNDSDSD